MAKKRKKAKKFMGGVLTRDVEAPERYENRMRRQLTISQNIYLNGRHHLRTTIPKEMAGVKALPKLIKPLETAAERRAKRLNRVLGG